MRADAESAAELAAAERLKSKQSAATPGSPPLKKNRRDSHGGSPFTLTARSNCRVSLCTQQHFNTLPRCALQSIHAHAVPIVLQCRKHFGFELGENAEQPQVSESMKTLCSAHLVMTIFRIMHVGFT